MGSVHVIEGDCLQVLPGIQTGSVGAVITDPPYIIGATSVGNGDAKCGTWADMENAAYWFAAWMKECKRVLSATGFLACFGNWRSLPTLIRALSLCEMPATSCLVWDKEWIGPAGPAQLRPTWELVVLSAMPDGRIADRSASDIVRCKWMAGHSKVSNHPAEKPVELLCHLIRTLCPPGGTVLDPFAGSGTTGVAAVQTDRGAILIEREPKHAETARRRTASAGRSLFAETPA